MRAGENLFRQWMLEGQDAALLASVRNLYNLVRKSDTVVSI